VTRKNDNTTDSFRDAALDRRRFLAWLSICSGSLAAALVGLPVVGFILAPVFRASPHHWVAVGPADRFTIGDTVLVSFENPSAMSWAGVTGRTGAWLRRVEENEFIAFVLNCSHLGCPVHWEPASELFMCPCHGGVYYADGAVAAGPPPIPLQRFRVRVRNGHVELDSRPIPIT
jgi:menaquinol-cytochrome c reductase iron-sulfur subunit